MKKDTLLAIAAVGTAFAEALTALANEQDGGCEVAAPASTDTKPKRGKAPATPEPEPEPTKKEEKAKASAGGKTYEELQKIIEPFVKGTWATPPVPRGTEVKAIIQKFKPADHGDQPFGLKDLASLTQHHAAFEKEIAALSPGSTEEY